MDDNEDIQGSMAALDQADADHGESPSSTVSSPGPDATVEQSQEPAQPQKRKGGRKPIYATSEERKQRNRQAQAAFRERRTEYIKQLEAAIKQNEDTLASLQQSHRSAADECLMLRYKNSLLERILLEKGVDVQAELSMKAGSHVIGGGFMPPGAGIPHLQQSQSQMQRSVLQRQQSRRSGVHNFLPKLAPGQSQSEMGSVTSPRTQLTPSSHASSPTQISTRSPRNLSQSGITSPTSAGHSSTGSNQFQAFPRPPHRQSMNQAGFMQMQAQQAAKRMQFSDSTPSTTVDSAGVLNTSASAFYPSPFQKHFDQLDQEYDAQHSQSMLDDPEQEDFSSDTPSTRMQGTFPPQFDPKMATAFNIQSSQTQYDQPQRMPQADHAAAADTGFPIDPNDPMLDADPFGLSASMHYPTSYSFDQDSRQR